MEDHGHPSQAYRRAAVALQHVSGKRADFEGVSVSPVSARQSQSANAEAVALASLLVPDHTEYRERLRGFLASAPVFRDNFALGLPALREQTQSRVAALGQNGFGGATAFVERPTEFFAFCEEVYAKDVTVGGKCQVQWNLFGGTILLLGTERHREAYARDADSVALCGCFGLTELGHGSNVRGLETTATYDAATKEFVIHTPSTTAQKYWLGGAGHYARACVAFARLVVPRTAPEFGRGNAKLEREYSTPSSGSYGLAAFFVPIRDGNGKNLPGIRTMDNGPKIGFNGVDNGRIWFDRVRVPAENLLDRYISVSPGGAVTSPIASPDRRFAVMLGSLVGGRVCIAASALSTSRVGLTIALRYALSRGQFAAKDQAVVAGATPRGETPLLTYKSVQLRLIEGTARVFVLSCALNELKRVFGSEDRDMKMVHVVASGMKAVCTWSKQEILQHCRECCGGQGMASANRFGVLKVDGEAEVTYEGDNTVLMLQTAKGILANKEYLQSEDVDISPLLEADAMREPYGAGALVVAAMGKLRAGRLQTLAQALKRANGDWNECTDLAVAAAEAHVHAICAEAAVRAARHADPKCQRTAWLLVHTFALSVFHRALGDILRFQMLSTSEASRVRDALAHCCALGARRAPALARGLGAPAHVVDSAPIAGDWVAANEYGSTAYGTV